MLLLCIPGLDLILVGDQPWIYEWEVASSPAPSGMAAECCDPAGCCNAGSSWLSGQAPTAAAYCQYAQGVRCTGLMLALAKSSGNPFGKFLGN